MRFLTFLFLLIFSFITSSLRAEDFLAGTSDIPLMNGLKINTSEQMDFDTPTGQLLIIEGRSIKRTGDEILKFYQTTLPQMGWEEKTTGVFVRQNDSLTLLILQNKNPAKIRFDISLTSDK